jgi:hypothetical protein
MDGTEYYERTEFVHIEISNLLKIEFNAGDKEFLY